MADQRCPDCHVQPGQPHDLGCDMARCPACGIQRLQCDAHADDRTLDARTVWTGAAPTVVGDYRQRCTDAALRFVLGQQELTSTSQIAWVGTLVDAVLAIRDQNAETLRSDNEELRKRAELAEAAIVRVREDHGESAYMPGYCFCANARPCPTVRALDGEDTGRG